MSGGLKFFIVFLALLVVLIGGYFATTVDWSKARDSVVNNDPGLYEVLSVADGDTIVIDMNGKNEKVRFIGIDTPEKNHPEFEVQCFALEAEKHLKNLIGNNKVRLEADPQNSNRDIYDRLLRFVYLPDGTFLNGRMIEDGYAFAYTSYSNSKLDYFKEAEKTAADQEIGLWSSCEVDLKNGRPLTNPA